MSTPFSQTPQGSDNQDAQQPYPAQQQYPQQGPGQNQSYDPHAPVTKERNTLGIIALVCAIIGAITAVIPGMLIIGWVLLPIAFILGLVALFFRDKKKGTAIAAVIVSIIGTLAGVIAFLFVVDNAFNDAFGDGDTTVSNEAGGSEGSDNAGSGDAGSTRDNPLPIGSTLESDDWAITINSVNLDATDAIMAENPFNEAPAEGMKYILVNYTVTYNGTAPEGSYPEATVAYVTVDGNTVNAHDTMVVTPEAFDGASTLYEGASTTGNQAYMAPADSAEQGTLAVNPSILGDTKFVAVQ